MHCTNCGAQLPDGSVFCTNCGSQMGQEEAKTFCTNCGSTVSASASACPTCGQVLSAPPAPEKKSLDIKKLIPVAAIAVVAILAIVLLCSLFGGNTMPQDGLDKLIDKGNFTIECEIDGEKMELMVDMNVKKGELTVYGENDDYIIAIYDGHMISGSEDYGYYAQDISDEIEMFFESYNNYDKTDWDELFATLEDEADIDVEDYVDTKKFEKCWSTFEDKLSNKKWLEETMDYEVETKKGVKIHSYSPDLYKFASATLEIFEKAFADEDEYEKLEKALKGYKSILKSMVEIKAELGVKGGYLVSGEIEFNGESFEFEITNIGKTKIDTDELEDLLDEAD